MVTLFAVRSHAFFVDFVRAVGTVLNPVAHHGRMHDAINFWFKGDSTAAVAVVREEAVQVLLTPILNNDFFYNSFTQTYFPVLIYMYMYMYRGVPLPKSVRGRRITIFQGYPSVVVGLCSPGGKF